MLNNFQMHVKFKWKVNKVLMKCAWNLNKMLIKYGWSLNEMRMKFEWNVTKIWIKFELNENKNFNFNHMELGIQYEVYSKTSIFCLRITRMI